MEWILLILILVFLIWSVQILMVYRKQVDKIETQITLVQTNREEVTVPPQKCSPPKNFPPPLRLCGGFNL